MGSSRTTAGHTTGLLSRPDVMVAWDNNANRHLRPLGLRTDSDVVAGWVCPNGHHYEASIADRCMRDAGCPTCETEAGVGPRVETEETRVETKETLTATGGRGSKGPAKPKPGRSLAELRPDIAAQWHPTKNGALTPADVSVSANITVEWVDEHGHEWPAPLPNRTRGGTGCPTCGAVQRGRSRRRPQPGRSLAELRPDIAAQWHPTKNGDETPADVAVSANRKAWWNTGCEHGDFEQLISARTGRGAGCNDCGRERRVAARRKPKPGHSLADRRPDVAALWHPTANGDMTPHDIGYGSKQEFIWLSNTCDYSDHHWPATVMNMVRLTGKCLYCTNQRVKVGFNDLATTHPHLVDEWDFERNGDNLPTMFVGGSRTSVHWVCGEGHQWPAVIEKRAVVGVGCQKCATARNAAARTIPRDGRSLAEVRPDLAAELHPNANGWRTGTTISAAANYAVEWIGPCGHQFDALPRDRLAGSGCPFCAGKRVLTGFNDLASQAPAAAAFWHPTRNGTLTPEQVTVGSQQKAHWLCDEGHETVAAIASRARSQNGGCGDCAVTVRGLSKSRPKPGQSLADLHPSIAAEWHPTKNWTVNPSEVHPGTNREAVWVGSCGHEWSDPVELRTARGVGCEVCTGHAVRAGVNDLATTHPELAAEWAAANERRPTEVSAGAHDRILWECQKCKHPWYSSVRDRARRGSGCSRCTNTHTSHSERRLFEAVRSWLQGAEQGQRFDWARFGPARISADISGTYRGRRIVVEYDGQFWHRDATERDVRKTALFVQAGYLVVRVREGKLHELPSMDGLIQVAWPSLAGTDDSTREAFVGLANLVREAIDAEALLSDEDHSMAV